MKIILAALALTLASIVAVAPQRSARADMPTDVFQVVCLPELDVLEVRELEIDGEEIYKVLQKRNDDLRERYGLYVPQWYDQGMTWDELMATDIRERYECRLSTGLAEVVLLPEELPSRDPWYSISVTLIVAGRMIVDDLPFTLCDKGGPITRLVYSAAKNTIALHGQFGGTRPKPPHPSFYGFKDALRLFFVDTNGIRSVDEGRGKWKARREPLRATDIDYLGVDYDRGEGTELQACRDELIGPSVPESRKQWLNQGY